MGDFDPSGTDEQSLIPAGFLESNSEVPTKPLTGRPEPAGNQEISSEIPTKPLTNRSEPAGNQEISSEVPTIPLKKRTILADRYEILEEIKSGVAGSVYKALDNKFNNILAIKELLLPDGVNPEDIKIVKDRFERETQILNKLHHSGIPEVVDHFTIDNRYYLAMTFIEGDSLKTIVSKETGNRLIPEKVIEISRKVLKILVYLHNQNPPVIHRNINPSSIIICKDGPVMLIDFGIAREITPDSPVMSKGGTPGYIPPEQYKGRGEARSDLYALGATMYYLITGESPFSIKPLKSIIPGIPGRLEKTIEKAMEHCVENRFSHSQDMLKALETKDSPEWNNEGEDLIRQKKYNNAINCFNEALKLKPGYIEALINKGYALYRLTGYNEALRCFDEVLKVNPKYAPAWNGKGSVLRGQKKYKKAIEYYNKALKFDPAYVSAWNGTATALDSLGKYGDAIKCYDEALKLKPDFAYIWNNKGYALRKLRKYDEAVKCFDEAIRLDPTFIDAWNNRGYALYKQGKNEEAIKCYDEAINLNPEFIGPLNGKAHVLDLQGKYNEAIQCLDKALRLDPGNTDIIKMKRDIQRKLA